MLHVFGIISLNIHGKTIEPSQLFIFNIKFMFYNPCFRLEISLKEENLNKSELDLLMVPYAPYMNNKKFVLINQTEYLECNSVYKSKCFKLSFNKFGYDEHSVLSEMW